MVYKLAYSRTKNQADAEDVFQEVFCRYFRNKTQFESDEYKKAWLIRVTVNCSNKLFSSAWFRRTMLLEENIEFDLLNLFLISPIVIVCILCFNICLIRHFFCTHRRNK